MKRYEIYKNIRKQAIIFGLPLSMFVIMMICIICSLLLIIFSFSFTLIMSLLVGNSVLYLLLLRFSTTAQHFQFSAVFPSSISNRRISSISYEKD
ncbi:hypothetical protein [Galbibacter marinus]|uniref:hypothetical protein n=1 Tax=Galbibacter marinus TaxID=555500 RepID=UPI000A041850|nr:hypothetical protein [Galbibacter marinus]